MNGTINNNNTLSVMDFFESRRATEHHSTHVSMVHPKGSFRLSRQDYDLFFKILEGMPLSEVSKLGIAEAQVSDFIPVLVDVDLKVDEDVVPEITGPRTRCLYDLDQVKQLVEKYQSILAEICDDRLESKRLSCVLLEKPMYKNTVGERVYVKNGFHLHFPFLVMDKKHIRVHLIPRIQEWIGTCGLFDDAGISNPCDIIDDAVVSNPWLMYGCKKDGIGMTPYTVSGVFLNGGEFVSVEEAFEGQTIWTFEEEPVELTRENISSHLHRLLSIAIVPGCTDVQDIRPSLAPPSCLRDDIPETVDLSNLHTDMFSNPTKDLQEAKEIIEFLNPHRAETYSEWMKVGWILYNISGGCREGFDMWNEFSRKSDKYDESVCLDLWSNSMERRSRPGLGSLIYMAKVDDLDGYTKWKSESDKGMIMSAIQTGGTHNDLARMMFAMYRTKFRCASVSNRTWFQFHNHAWESMEEGTYLRAKISDPEDGLVGAFQTQVSQQRSILAAETDEAAKLMHQKRIDILAGIIKNLKTCNYKNNVMRECTEVFYDNKFLKELDQDRMKVAFNNGVYDLKENKFRDGLPEDYISVKMPVNYRTFKRSDDAVKHVELFLEQVFPDPSVRTYFLDVYSEIFEGGNSRKIVLIWTGNGDNGKSVTQKLLEKLLGKLAIKFSTTLLSGTKTKLGNAAPEMARAKPPVRHATMDEPDSDEKLNCGLMKQLSGGDSYWARDLFQKGSETMEITPMFTLTLLCNSLPRLRHPDRATWNRIRVIPFESKFPADDKECPDTYEEQLRQKKFPRDPSFGDKIPGMLEALAWYLLQHRAGWPDADGNRTQWPSPDPIKVKEATLKYERENDTLRGFLDQDFEDKEGGKVRVSEVWERFKDWWKMNHARTQDMPVESMEACRAAVVEIWGQPQMVYGQSCWVGKCIRKNMSWGHNDDDVGETSADLMMQ